MTTTWRNEFPDFRPEDMPAIPAGFLDTSWRNDVCPSFTSDPLGLTLWIDYLNPADREYPAWSRFRLEGQDHGIDKPHEFALDTDDFNDVLAAIAERTAALEAKG
jgi:hypothetical protein